MTPGDPPDEDGPGPPKPDLRVASHQDGEVQIDRNLKGEGRLARGDRTHFSQLKFRLQAQARTERDPVFEGRDAPPAAPTPPPAPPTPTTAASPPPQAPEAPAAEGSAVARLFRRLRFW